MDVDSHGCAFPTHRQAFALDLLVPLNIPSNKLSLNPRWIAHGAKYKELLQNRKPHHNWLIGDRAFHISCVY